MASNKSEEVSAEEMRLAFDKWSLEEYGPLFVDSESAPKVPKTGEKNVLITSALPYVNNVPHLGNLIGSTLSSDVFARYSRLRGWNTLFLCGTDEYGTATETKAIQEGVTPQEICDKYHKIHADVYKWFNVSFDYFGRTTTKEQTEISQQIFWKLHENGYIITDEIQQLYCTKCERFLADRFVEGTCPSCSFPDARGDQCDGCGKLINAPELKQPKCTLCSNTPQLKSTSHLFLDLPKLQPKIEEWFETTGNKEDGGWSQTARGITLCWLRDGLKPRCITRDLKWGTPVPLPEFSNKVFYVWYDAPIGYPSITAHHNPEWQLWWRNPEQVELHQFMGKDNVLFHSIIFPACELGTGDKWTMIKYLHATEYLNYEDDKFSKSRGVGVFGDNAKDTEIPSDIWRFYLIFVRPETQDSVFSWNDLMTKNNTELLNNLGNFINRCLMFLNNNFAGTVPEIVLNEEDQQFLVQINNEVKSYVELLDKVKLRDGIRTILNISRLGNQHIQSNKPWEMVKGDEISKSRAGSVMALCSNVAALLSVLLLPYMPETAKIIQQQLNIQVNLLPKDISFRCLIKSGHKINKPAPIFKKIEQSQVDALKKRFAGKAKVTTVDETLNGVEMSVEELQKLITETGDRVRKLKSEKSDKSTIEGEVKKLLSYKQRLAVLSPELAQVNSGNKKSKNKNS